MDDAEQRLAQVWGYATPDDLAGDTQTVSVHIHWLRQLLETDPEHPQVIQTVRGPGYHFLAEALTQDSTESMQVLQ